jgi:hypothetical protein
MSYAEEEMLRALGAGLDRLQAAAAVNLSPVIPVRPVQVLDSTEKRKLSAGQIGNYLQHGGIHCPDCLNHDIEGGSVEIEHGTAWQDCTCNACGLRWTDGYQLCTVIKIEFAPRKGEEGTLSTSQSTS